MFEDTNRFRNKNGEDTSSGLALAPMIDVVFLLLIFFMVSTTFVIRSGLKIELPTAQSKSQVPADQWVISITPDGNYYLNQEQTSMSSISEQLKSNPKPVTIRADRTIPHGMVVDVLDTVQLAGIQSVNVSTTEPRSE